MDLKKEHNTEPPMSCINSVRDPEVPSVEYEPVFYCICCNGANSAHAKSRVNAECTSVPTGVV